MLRDLLTFIIIFVTLITITAVVMIRMEVNKSKRKNINVAKKAPQIPGKTRVRIDNFEPKYRSVMDPSLFAYLQKQKLNGEEYAYLDKSVIRELNDRMAGRKSQQVKLYTTAANNNNGIKYEKSGNIEDAIAVYENNISGDCYPACHSFDRLMILYRKQKRYDDEIRIIERAIDVLCPRYPDLLPKYEQRLQKATELSKKNKLTEK